MMICQALLINFPRSVSCPASVPNYFLLLAALAKVVDACMLAEALRRYLSDETPLQHLPTYKATVYRMEATMAGGYCKMKTSSLIYMYFFLCDGRKFAYF
jgi:hypothetical protein